MELTIELNAKLRANAGELIDGGTLQSVAGEIEKCFMFSWWEGTTENALYF